MIQIHKNASSFPSYIAQNGVRRPLTAIKALPLRLTTIDPSSLFRNLFKTTETVMRRTVAEPRVDEEGVTFTVEVGFTERECVVSKNALAHLSRRKGDQFDYMATYRAFEDQIHSVARRLVVAGVSGSPLVLGAAYFV
jgi:hypothetical protein